jgi:hypothetical protein
MLEDLMTRSHRSLSGFPLVHAELAAKSRTVLIERGRSRAYRRIIVAANLDRIPGHPDTSCLYPHVSGLDASSRPPVICSLAAAVVIHSSLFAS